MPQELRPSALCSVLIDFLPRLAYHGLGFIVSLVMLSAAIVAAQERADSSNTAQDTRALEFGKSIERELVGGEVHAYQINLATGQYLHVVVDQRGIDVVVTLFGPGGKPIAEVDSPNGTQGPEPISVIIEASGMYRLEVRSLEKAASMGRYYVKIDELRKAAPSDKNRVMAEKTFAEATQLYIQGTAESLRQAIAKYEKALPHWRAIGDRSGEATALNMIGVAHRALGQGQKALDYSKQALPLRRSLGDSVAVAQTLNNIGDAYGSLSQPEKALEYLEQALRLRRALGLKTGEEITLSNISAVYFWLGDPQEALEYLNLALPLARSEGDRVGEATTLTNIGLAYNLLGEKQKAQTCYAQALLIWREQRNLSGEATVLNNIGQIYSDLGESQQALEYFLQALTLRRSAGDRHGETFTLNNIGYEYAVSGERQKSLQYLEQALKLAQELDIKLVQAFALNNLSRLHDWMGDTQLALAYCTQALDLSRAVSSRSLEARILGNQGSFYAHAGEKQKARDCYNQALLLSRAVGDRNTEAMMLASLAQVERDPGNLDHSRVRIEMALAIVDSLRTRVISQELRASYFASKHDYFEFYIDLLMQLHQVYPSGSHDAAALQASERARARSLLETITEAHADIRQGVEATLVERERALQQQLNVKADRLTRLLSSKNTEAQAAAAKKELDALLTEYQEVQARIRANSPRYAALTQSQPLTVNEIQQQVLDDETILLEYALGKERSFLWAVTPTSLASFALPRRAEIDSLARHIYDLLTARNQRSANETPKQKRERVTKADADYQQTAVALSRILLAPVADQLEAKRLLVVTEGALQYIPFDALPAPQTTDYRPLTVDHEIVSLPSASVLAVLRHELKDRIAASKTIAVLADPVFASDDPRLKRSKMIAEQKIGEPDSSLDDGRLRSGELERVFREINWVDTTGLHIPRLPFSRQEAEGIVSKLPANESMKALDFAASRATAMSAELSQYRIVHFATHGLLNSVHPELSGIVLSLINEQGEPQDGFLRLHEIYNLNLPADLIVLSACQTALGKEIKGEGLIGLTRGFMYAGAARVVASLWKVDDEATAELMKRFYQGMLGPEKLRPAAALRTAQVSMWKEKRWQAPYYWAAFVQQGEWK